MSEVYGNRYEVIERVGDGGMATVYRGLDRVLKRDVAIKVMHPHLASRNDARARFNREAQAIARLHHSNIVDVYDFSVGTDETAFLVTEFVHGETLSQFVGDHGPFLPQAAALIGHAVAGALAHAHTVGIVHRDIKPDNLMISSDGQCKLMDFGIATALDLEHMTATGAIVGSPAHMAPEQIEGVPLDHRCDIFALGIVLYFLVARRLPFVASNPHALFRLILEGRFDPPSRHNPAIDRTFDAIVTRCLQRRPEDRYPNMAAMQQALGAYLKHYRMSDVPTLLSRFLQTPDGFQFELRPSIVNVLTTEGRRYGETNQLALAIDSFNRALVVDPEANEPKLGLQALTSRSRRLRRMRRIGQIAAAVLGAALLLWGAVVLYKFLNPPPPPPPESAAGVQPQLLPVAPAQLIDQLRRDDDTRRIEQLASVRVEQLSAEQERRRMAERSSLSPGTASLAVAERLRRPEEASARRRVNPPLRPTEAGLLRPIPEVVPPPPMPMISMRLRSDPPSATLVLDGRPLPVEGSSAADLLPGSEHELVCQFPSAVQCSGRPCPPSRRRFKVPLNQPGRGLNHVICKAGET